MLNELIALFTGLNEPALLRLEIVKLRRILEKTQLQLAQSQAENRRLRRRLADAELRLLRQAEADATLIGALHFAGLYTSRRACATVGIGCNRWMRAQALLRLARVHDGRGLDVATPDDFERAVRVAGERVRRDGMDVLRHRLPLCLQWHGWGCGWGFRANPNHTGVHFLRRRRAGGG